MANNQEEMRSHLLSQELTSTNGDEEQPSKKSSKEDRFMVYLSTMVAVCGSYAFGSCAGYSSPTQADIIKDVNLSLAEYSLVSSILTFGAMIGAITSGKIADYIGRKWAMRISGGFCTAGWLLIYFAKGVLLLEMGRLATGYGMGVFSFVVPVFIAEIAPKDLRGALTTLNQLMICTGVCVSYIIGTVLSWRALALIGLYRNSGEASKSQSARFVSEAISELSHGMALFFLHEIDSSYSSLKSFNLVNQFVTQIGVGLMVCQQFGGINGVGFYTSSIFESSGFPADVGTIIYAILQVIITTLGAPLIDRAGRKPLLVVNFTIATHLLE
ncbi:hypothetical protein BUALT_Bualt02G0225500 [Buddleja alternifolia]|uniref:Major facilitator superfamily (MFS) profile domain-containing protein n=1 Tax=Buddleja alternifolia TaxID=168488 RepID=A0AAV6YB70_9LAMI|nr:hypothetical protein BUALT_Bualt02G0225500 [Buddleja alternifolia]